MKNSILQPILKTFLLIVFVSSVWSCDNTPKTWTDDQRRAAANPEFLHRSLDAVSENIKHDIFPPMIAARIYSYANIAAWEAVAAGNPSLVSMSGQLKDLPKMPPPVPKAKFATTWQPSKPI